MTAQLIVINDALAGEREDHELVVGARLSDELMRIFAEGLEGLWRLYDREIAEGYEISKVEAMMHVIEPGDLIILVRVPGTPNVWIQLGVALILSFFAYVLTPFPPRPRATSGEQRESGTNQLAGQSNMLRPGARVPEILGRVRSYPDLLTMPVELWPAPSNYIGGSGMTQTIEQFFVIGIGAYDIENEKLGETPIRSIEGASVQPFQPGDEVVKIKVIKRSTTVDQISLDAVQTSSPPVGGVQFIASTKQMITPTLAPVITGAPTTIGGTLDNNGVRFVVSGPSGSGPFTYVLEGPVVDEPSANASFAIWEQVYNAPRFCTFTGNDIQVPGALFGVSAGDAISFTVAGLTRYGIIGGVVTPPGNTITILADIKDMYGVDYAFPFESGVETQLQMWTPPPLALRSADAAAEPRVGEEADVSAWHSVPMDEPDEIWIDIAFPGGLLKYESGERASHGLTIRADFHRAGAGDDVVQYVARFHPSSSRQRYLQWTYRVPVAAMALPGSGPIEVRLQRETPVELDTATTQYVSDTRWKELRGMKELARRVYPDVTIVRLGLTNSRSAMSLGEQTYNAVVTRRLKTWTAGSGWSGVATATRKWADSFVARCQAKDGANRADADIDLAGIYALQAQLDALDGGALGQISMTLDQQQDIDTELAQIADVVRAVVYRVGRRLHVTRDQANATPLALFNGRTKSSEGETVAVRMKSDDENDAVLVQWVDELSAWKQREYQYPEGFTPANVLRIATSCANWAQAFRRAVYEWNKVRYRREQISVGVTEDGRICRPGDVVHVTDDVANLALAAGEVLFVSDTQLVVDRDIDFSAAGTYTILLRDIEGRAVDAIPCAPVIGSANRVQLSRAPIAGVRVKGRDESLGTLYALYNDANVTARQWLLTSVEANGPFVQLNGFNYTPRVYEGDALALPARPVLS